MSSVRIWLFGHPRIRVGTERVETRLSAQSILVLAALLSAPDRTVNREELAFTLWPDVGEGEARAALRRHLYRLQRAFPEAGAPWFACDARSIAWGPADTWVDAVRFDDLCGDAESLSDAAALYGGAFLEPIDHEWAAATRERLRRKAVATFEALASRSEAVGDDAVAAHALERLLDEDPWREDALRRLMVLRFRASDRAGALSRYRDFRHRLRAEFDVEPMPETVQCYAAIASGSATPAPALFAAGI